MKILKITEKQPINVTLPDGLYFGTLGGYSIEIQYKNKTYELTVEEGVRGVGFKVVVKIENGIGTYEFITN